MQTDYIPRQDAELDNWFRNIIEYVEAKTDKDNPEWTHIPRDRIDELKAAYDAWHAAYLLTLSRHEPQLTREKNRVRLESERVLRDFIKQFLRGRPVTNLDRDYMGLNNYDLIRTDHKEVHEDVEFELVLRRIREIIVKFWIKGASNKAKPHGYNGAVIAWDVLDAPPARPEDLTHHELASRTPYTIKFDETQRGKTVYIAAQWENRRGIKGPWSEIQSAVVP